MGEANNIVIIYLALTPLRLADPQICSTSGVAWLASDSIIRHTQAVIPLLDLRITHYDPQRLVGLIQVSFNHTLDF